MSMTAKCQLLDLSFKTNRLSPIQCPVQSAEKGCGCQLYVYFICFCRITADDYRFSFLVTSQYKKNITSCPALCTECIVYSLGAHSCVFSNPAAFMLRPVSSWHCKTWSNNRRAEDEAASAPAHPCVYGKFTNDLLIRRCPDDVFWLVFFCCVFPPEVCVFLSPTYETVLTDMRACHSKPKASPSRAGHPVLPSSNGCWSEERAMM